MREPEFLFFFFFNGICAKEGSLCPFSSIYTYTYERTCSTIFCTWDILYYATYAILLLPHVNTNRYTNGMGLHCCIRQQNVYVAMYIRIILWYIYRTLITCIYVLLYEFRIGTFYSDVYFRNLYFFVPLISSKSVSYYLFLSFSASTVWNGICQMDWKKLEKLSGRNKKIY